MNHKKDDKLVLYRLNFELDEKNTKNLCFNYIELKKTFHEDNLIKNKN